MDTMFYYSNPKDEQAVKALVAEKDLMDLKAPTGYTWTKRFGYVEKRVERGPAPLNCDTCRVVVMHHYDTFIPSGFTTHDVYKCDRCGNTRIWG